MGNARKFSTLLAAAGFMVSGAAQAALHDRGGGLLYDDVLNVTWLQDANYAKTSGYDADGLMDWSAANVWATNLFYHDSVRGADWNDWRLARNGPIGSAWTDDSAYDGSADSGYNITSPHSELAYMYYVNLGLKGYFSPTGTLQPDSGIHRDGSLGGEADVGPVKNLQPFTYWSGTQYVIPRYPYISLAWFFRTVNGYQSIDLFYNEFSAWAVRDGDVAAVPEPETYALFLAGLAVMGRAVRRRTGGAG